MILFYNNTSTFAIIKLLIVASLFLLSATSTAVIARSVRANSSDKIFFFIFHREFIFFREIVLGVHNKTKGGWNPLINIDLCQFVID